MVKKYCRLILFIAVVAAVVLYLPQLSSAIKFTARALKPVLIALFFALFFHIPINFLSGRAFKKIKKEKLRYVLSLVIVYVLVFGLLGAGVYFLAPEVVESVKGFAAKLPEYTQNLSNKLASFFPSSQLTNDKITAAIGEFVIKLTGTAEGAFVKIKEVGSSVMNLFFAVVLSVYMLLDRKRLIRQFSQFSNAILPRKVYDYANKSVNVASVIFAKFLGGQVIESILLGLLTLGGMYALRLPYAPLISAVVFVSNLIPLIGAYIGGIVGFVMIAFVDIKKAVIFIIFSIVLQQFENNVTYPKVVGNSLGLSGFWVMSAVLVGGALFGFWGVVLSVPAVAVIYKMLGYTLSRNSAPGALIPDGLKKSDKQACDDCADERSKK